MGAGPRVVCLCGRTAFWMRSTGQGLLRRLAGRVVLSIGSTYVGDDEALSGMSALERDDALARHARLHRHKIEMADEVSTGNVVRHVLLD